jgi:large subunit ribosomal protein L5
MDQDRRSEAGVTKARKSVAGFKMREGWPIGCKVTCAASACTSSWIA